MDFQTCGGFYQRKIDKSAIPTCNIMGVDIAAVDMPQLLNFISTNIRELSGDYICVANVHTTVVASEDEEYQKIQNGGIMAIPDGGPLAMIGRKRGCPQMRRTAGPDLMGEIFSLSLKRNYRHYFYGSKQETLDKLCRILTENYHGIEIAGMYSPPFRPLSKEEDREAVLHINEANADFIWVGLGAPKQERWMAAHQGKVHGLMIGVGAGFDYFAGNIKRAPGWMQKSNLEWFYRLMQDPRRLLGRYLSTNMKFIWNTAIRGK